MESGTATVRGVPADYSASWNTLVAAMGCGNSSAAKTNAPEILACMRAVPVATIKDYNEHNRLGWAPVFDNVTSVYTARANRLSSTPANPKIARVPILGGSNAHEGRLYSVSAANATSFVRGLFPTATDADIAALLATYPGYSSEFRQLAALYTDFIFQCPARLVALETAKAGIPSYRYYYNASFPNSQIFDDAGVYHASEIGIVLGTYTQAGATPFQIELSRYLQKVWTDFAKDPYGWGRPPWPAVPTAMGELGGGVRAEDGPNARGDLLDVLSQQETDAVDSGCAKFQAIYDFLGH
jgi:cholinesterase